MTGHGKSSTVNAGWLDLGDRASTIAFFDAEFAQAFAGLDGSSVTARDPSVALPEFITARITDVMRDQARPIT